MRMRNLLSMAALAALILCVSPLGAQQNIVSEIRLDSFKEAHPKARFHGQQYFDDEGFFEFVGTQNMIYGTTMSKGLTAQQSGWDFYNQIEGIYAQEVGKLVPNVLESGEVLQGVMWNRETETHKFYVFRFNQEVAGLPVYRSGVSFLVRNEDGYPVVASTNNLKEMVDFDETSIDPNINPEVSAEMLVNVNELFKTPNVRIDGSTEHSILDIRRDLQPIEVSQERLVLWSGVTNVKEEETQLAVEFMAQRGSNLDFDTYRKYLVVASLKTGEILHSETQIHSFDVTGSVSGNGSDGDAAIQCENTAEFALPYAEVSISGGNTAFADALGNFTIQSNAGGTVTVNSRLEGLYFDLFDQSAGGSTPVISLNVADPGSVDFLHNPNPTELATANVNNYLHSNIVRDFVLSYEPTFPVIANQIGFNVNSNLGSNCNAFYDGSSINMYTSGGGCGNTAIPDVIYHEYGHHLINVTGNGQGQLGEGSGDTIGVLIEDDPNLAPGFLINDCVNGIRNAENFREYPCNGAIHDCGQLISGCVWDTINEIRVDDPVNAVDITSGLFIGMLVARGQMFPGNSTIGPEITILFLELDDDDGNIGNGTPNYQYIAAAFNAHNMMAPDLDLLGLTFPNGLPDSVSPAGGTSFLVDVEEIGADHAAGTGVLHYNYGFGFQQVAMNVVDADTYEAVFPAGSECLDEIQFYVSVDTTGGVTETNPSNAPTTSFATISAAALDIRFDDDFESNQGWSVTGNAGDGQWNRGIPAGGGDRGDPGSDADGSGRCYLTDNADGNSDVDDGSTTLTSPIMNGEPGDGEIAVLTYSRWYSNHFGNSPFADTFVVEISNNGGSSWVNLETVGPDGPEVSGGWFRKQFILDNNIITPTANMRIRFTASDLGDGSVVEAGVDAVSINMIQCDAGCMPGDINMDGEINLLDVSGFVDAVSSGEYSCEADINEDGIVNLLDVAGFISLLGG